jgi:tRNA pseudouridine55 synthase
MSEGLVDGLVVVDKPGGLTSHDVVARARRALGTRKVGHAGTLDPMATGVLLLGVGRATRLLGHLALRDKEYRATIRLGARTVSDDADGEITAIADSSDLAAIGDDDVRAGLRAQTGTISQRPSSVSAIKVDGRRAHARVRAGEEVELDAREVQIARIDVLDIRRTAQAVDVDVEVSCSTGTYIRSIARDLGESLAVGGHLTALRRTRVGPFALAQACTLEALAAEGPALLQSIDAVAAATFPLWPVDADAAEAVRHGRRIRWTGPTDVVGPVAVVDGDGLLLALATDDDGLARYSAVLA